MITITKTTVFMSATLNSCLAIFCSKHEVILCVIMTQCHADKGAQQIAVRRRAWKIRKRCQGSRSEKQFTENYQKTKIELEGKQLSTKTEIESFRRLFFWNRNFILFHSCIIDNLVYRLTLFSLFG